MFGRIHCTNRSNRRGRRRGLAAALMLLVLNTLPILHQRVYHSSSIEAGDRQIHTAHHGVNADAAPDDCAICNTLPGGAAPLGPALVLSGLCQTSHFPSLSADVVVVRPIAETAAPRGPPA